MTTPTQPTRPSSHFAQHSDDTTRDYQYVTDGGISISRRETDIVYENATAGLIDSLDTAKGVLLSSSYEFPGRYSRWDMGFSQPPLEVTGRDRGFAIHALNDRGRILLPAIAPILEEHPHIEGLTLGDDGIFGTVGQPAKWFAEEERSQQPSLFSVVRILRDLFAHAGDERLGLYGSFGYDLALQFEQIALKQDRPADHKDLHLYLPDSIITVDHAARRAVRLDYEFAVASGENTRGLARNGAAHPPSRGANYEAKNDMGEGEYARIVDDAKPRFARGELFEVVPSRVFRTACTTPPSEIFHRLKRRNPAPYGFLINLGHGEHLIGASPEMYVRVSGKRVETCPISGTIARGRDAIEDAENIRTLLNSTKEESELTMCTDVDRNDKARVCNPGSIRIIGRRQIEMYSRLIHTVDHVEGRLREGFDALDAFLTHCWAVTVTGAPKRAAMTHIENVERSPRAWYGGAIGAVLCNGDLNTGLTLRTVRLKQGIAEVRAGATLLYDSESTAEEAETVLKASAMIDAITRPDSEQNSNDPTRSGIGKRVLLVDHEDSFVQNLASYIRATGAETLTMRPGFPDAVFDEFKPDLVFLSPGPGRPDDYGLRGNIERALAHGLPVFGVCLGLQGIVEFFGGSLGQLDTPMHGKPSKVHLQTGDPLFDGLPENIVVGRYHSLFADPQTLPSDLLITAKSSDGVVMGIRHKSLPISAVQFHPESLLTLQGEAGMHMIANLLRNPLGRPGGKEADTDANTTTATAGSEAA
ncbi:anthranilate synthase component I [Thalassospira marina]|uniref:Anthranilate synthase n=1 Tax=Thalassospira marina TaxID=2048283 RepID=A0ABM6Q4H2_9PROT|nr:anthranilate synthase component I [Thalassospira marina]AUG51397.1 anthranilate synthase component I [Thalassospira marina]